MIRLLAIGILHLFTTLICFGQNQSTQKSNTAFLVTRIVQSKSEGSTEKDNVKFLYVSNPTGDQIVVYKYSDGMISEAIDYRLRQTKEGLYLTSKRLFSNETEVNNLCVAFNDQTKSIHIGESDQYSLFAQNYVTYKDQINTKHSVVKLANLLIDNIGDYPLESLLPFISTSDSHQFGRGIQKAKIVTQRGQADIKDEWLCIYTYNKSGKVSAVKAASGNDVRFYKKISYSANQIVVESHQNIEDRQITTTDISIDPKKKNQINWKEIVLEPGKNRETELLTSLSKKDLGTIAKLQMTEAEAVNFIKKIK